MFKKLLTGAVLAALSTTAAFAHITLETPEAPAGSTYKAVLRVPHGCSGSATTAIKVQIPEGFFNVKPMPKAGWTLATTKGAYAKGYDLYGAQVSEGVKEITWSGGNLPDEFYDEFVFRGLLAGAVSGTPVYFPVVQSCGSGEEAWIEIPVDGQPEPELPAPGLKITDKVGDGH
ncbi:MAG: YcnI family protein [Cypionkella sp.]